MNTKNMLLGLLLCGTAFVLANAASDGKRPTPDECFQAKISKVLGVNFAPSDRKATEERLLQKFGAGATKKSVRQTLQQISVANSGCKLANGEVINGESELMSLCIYPDYCDTAPVWLYDFTFEFRNDRLVNVYYARASLPEAKP
jgi:hypothetical protein